MANLIHMYSCRSLEGIVDKLRSDRLVDGVSLDNILDDEDGEDESGLPGSGSGTLGHKNDGSRNIRPEILTSCVRFSNTGTEWAAATTQGLQVIIDGYVYHVLISKFTVVFVDICIGSRDDVCT